MANKKSVQAWFAKANEDLFAATFLHGSKNPKSFLPIAFHCQQTIEKAIKGLLTFHDKKFEKTHDLKEIMGLILQIDPSLETVLKPTIELTPFAVAFRYPDALNRDLSLTDVDSFIRLTNEVYKELSSRVQFDSAFDV